MFCRPGNSLRYRGISARISPSDVWFSPWSLLLVSGSLNQGDRDVVDGLCRGLSCEENAFSVFC